MKSRVQKNQELHQELATNTENDLESSNLSQFAERLNQIDDQFKRMNSSAHLEHEPQRARVFEETQEVELSPNVEPVEEVVPEPTTSFDTFENAYLKDFLDEVKDYNVKRGYDEPKKTKEDTNVSPVDADAIQSVLDEINQYRPVVDEEEETLDFVTHVIEEEPEDVTELEEVEEVVVSDFEDAEATRIFSLDSLNNPKEILADVDEVHSETVSISQAVKDMVEETIAQDDVYDALQLDEPEMEIFESIELPEETFSFDDEKFRQELLEQTQTLQHKIIDQERNIDEMNETMVRTNRMLNVVLSLLLLAVVVVLILIFSYYF